MYPDKLLCFRGKLLVPWYKNWCFEAKFKLPVIILSRARRCIENTFGIMAAKFRILLRPIETSHEVSDAIVKALCLYNFLLEYSPPGKWPREMADYGLRNEDNGAAISSLCSKLQQ